MRHPWANVALLLLLSAQLVTGLFGFLNGAESDQWLLWLHGIGAYAIAVLLLWKSAIILDVYSRGTTLNWRRFAFAVMALLLLATLVSGLVWTFDGPRFLFGFSLVTLHIFLAVALILLVAWHAWQLRWILRAPQAVGRRSFLQSGVFGLVGLVLWRGAAVSKDVQALSGASRRFTGSYETGSYSGVFPKVSWIADRPSAVNLDRWQFVMDGAVQRPVSMNYDELLELVDAEFSAILDCTGGWYSEQVWRGVHLDRLLRMVRPISRAQSITVEAVSGYSRRFSLSEAQSYLLATEVAGTRLSHGHGFPLRLVAPDQRGVNWVKWITRIRVNETGKHWQSPLPLR